MKYQIVVAKSRKRLEKEINGLIQEDWRPIGGVAVERDRVSSDGVRFTRRP